MSQVTIGHIESAIDKIEALDEQGIENLSKAQTETQPTLVGYVMSAADEYENEDLESLLIYYFTIITSSFENAGIKCKTVTDDMIDDMEEAYFQVLDNYFESENLEVLEEFSDQPDLVRFMLMEAGMEDEDGEFLEEETATQLFIVSLSMISLLSRSIEA